jgi:hypothetical protein
MNKQIEGEQEKKSVASRASSPRPAPASTEKRDVFFIMVLHPLSGWMRAGNAYQSKSVAHGWVSFVKKAWRGLPVKVVKFRNRVSQWADER